MRGGGVVGPPDEATAATDGGAGLWVVDELLTPLLKRFRFHFEGRRETNRRDKPEWMYSHCAGILRLHAHFLSTYIQPMLLAPLSILQTEVSALPGAPRRVARLHGDARTACSHGALPAVAAGLCRAIRAKLAREQLALLAQPQAFCHTLNETIAFERDLRDLVALPPEVALVLPAFSEAPVSLALWIRIETEDARAVLQRVTSSDAQWRATRAPLSVNEGLDDSVDASDAATPTCAVLLTKHIDTQVKRIALLPSEAVQGRFVREIVAPLLEQFTAQIRARVAMVAVGARDTGNWADAGGLAHVLSYAAPRVAEWQESAPLVGLASAFKPPATTPTLTPKAPPTSAPADPELSSPTHTPSGGGADVGSGAGGSLLSTPKTLAGAVARRVGQTASLACTSASLARTAVSTAASMATSAARAGLASPGAAAPAPPPRAAAEQASTVQKVTPTERMGRRRPPITRRKRLLPNLSSRRCCANGRRRWRSWRPRCATRSSATLPRLVAPMWRSGATSDWRRRRRAGRCVHPPRPVGSTVRADVTPPRRAARPPAIAPGRVAPAGVAAHRCRRR